jgi:DNA-binding MarR family transcriptional regulator
MQIISMLTLGGRMNQSFHYLIMINQALFQKKVLNKLMKMGLTPGQPKVLDYLSVYNGSMQKDIAYGCQIDPATLTGILERMEEKGLVERRIMNGNRRSSYVYLTESGKEKSKKVAEAFVEIETEVFQGIDEGERDQFMDVLYKICCHMTDEEKLR